MYEIHVYQERKDFPKIGEIGSIYITVYGEYYMWSNTDNDYIKIKDCYLEPTEFNQQEVYDYDINLENVINSDILEDTLRKHKKDS